MSPSATMPPYSATAQRFEKRSGELPRELVIPSTLERHKQANARLACEAVRTAMIFILCSGLLFATSAAAETQDKITKIKEHRDWTVYAYEGGGKQYCYAGTFALRRRGQTAGWPESWLLISRETSIGARDSVSFVLGRPLAANRSAASSTTSSAKNSNVNRLCPRV